MVDPRLRFGSRASAVRRGVGPTAWVVLEELVLAAQAEGPRCRRAEASVRSLGRDLGLAKDTVANALRRLAAEGLVRREDRRQDRRGTFAPGGYILDAGVLADVLSTAEPVRTSTRGSRASSAESLEQASLFDERTGA